MSCYSENLAVKQVQEIAALVAESISKSHSYVVGKNYFFRTLSYHYTGRLVSVTDSDLVLEDAAWIADSGRFSNALKSGEFDEVEPYPDGTRLILNRQVVVDACELKTALPRRQK